MLLVADTTRAVPTIGAIRRKHAADLLGVEADLGCRFEVHRIRDRRGIDGDQAQRCERA